MLLDLSTVSLCSSLGSPQNSLNPKQSLMQSVSCQMWVALWCRIKIHLEMQVRRRKPPFKPGTLLVNQDLNLVSCSEQVLRKLFSLCRLQE